MKYGSLFLRWFLSYILFIVISLLFILGIYNIFGNNLKKEVNNLNKTFLKQVKTLIDGQIESIDQTSVISGLTKEIRTAIFMQENLTTSNRYTLIKCLENLKLYNCSNENIKSIYLYLQRPCAVITNDSAYMKNYLGLLTESKFSLRSQEFIRKMSRNYQREIISLDNKLLYLQSLPMEQKSLSLATLIIEIDMDKIAEYLGHDNSDNLGYIAIIDEKDKVLISKGENTSNIKLRYNDFNQVDTLNLKVEGSTYIAYSHKSKVKHLRYVSIVPEHLYWREANKLKNNTILIVILLSIVGILLAYWLTQRNYKPLKKIVSHIKKNSEKVDNEYKFIEEVIDKNEKLQHKMKIQLQKQNEVLKDTFLVKLLKGTVIDINTIMEQLHSYNIYFEHNIMILVFRIDYYKMIDNNTNTNEEYILAQFIIKNIFSEIISEVGNIHMIDVDAMVVGILSYSNEDELSKELLEDILVEVYNHINNKFNIKYTTAISSIHNSLHGISDAYREALDAMAYTKILGDVETIFYADTLTNNVKYSYDIAQEQQLINIIKSGEYERANEYIRSIIDQQLTQNVSVDIFQCFIYDLISTIIKTIDTEEQQKIFDDLKPIRSLMQCKGYDQIADVLSKIVKSICIIKREENNNHQKEDLSKKVYEYIVDNYHKADINVSLIGHKFNLTPAYLSKIYKLERGESILNTINTIRIEQAKYYLTNTNYTINDIAIKVGFTYTNAFIRVFKKYEGITPGKYKILS